MLSSMLPPDDHCAHPLAVLLAVRRTSTRLALWSLLEAEPALTPVGSAEDYAAVVRMTVDLRPNVVLVDRRILGAAGLERIPVVVGAAPGVAVFLVGMGDHPRIDAHARRAGAAGYLRLDEAPDRLSRLVRSTAAPSAA
jgi:DNA-binding NarL/FixJ family response regulator